VSWREVSTVSFCSALNVKTDTRLVLWVDDAILQKNGIAGKADGQLPLD
jgi:hypothetical protein